MLMEFVRWFVGIRINVRSGYCFVLCGCVVMGIVVCVCMMFGVRVIKFV